VRIPPDAARLPEPAYPKGRAAVRTLVGLIAAIWLGGWTSGACATVRYQISLAHPEQHLLHVTLTVPEVKDELIVQMAAWNALYQIRDFASHVGQVEAYVLDGTESRGQKIALKVERLDKQTWRIRGTGEVTIQYSTYWDEPGPFSTQLNSEHAFINPAMVLMYLPQRRNEQVQLEVAGVPVQWKLESSALAEPGHADAARGFVLEASGFDQLADSPIETGQYERLELDLPSRVSVVVHGDNWRKARLEDELSRIVKYQLQLMGGAPFDHYTFIFHIGRAAAGAGGGMEHTNSTAISVPSDEFLAGVSAHEFFHLWNVKRIRPSSLEPIDYTKEQYSRALWFAEGVTSTYGSYTLERSGIWSKEQLYNDLAQQISALERRPASRWQSAEESSLDAWLEKYPLYDQPDYSVSYYTKGQILGVLLDLLIRQRTGNSKSLDDVLRVMNTEFGKPGKPYRDSVDIKFAAEKVSGSSFAEFFARYVSQSEPLPYEQTLALAGLKLRKTERKYPSLGFFLQRDGAGNAVVHNLEPGSAAAAGGLETNDAIVEWNGNEPPKRLDRWLRDQHPGDVVRLRIRRAGRESEVQFPLTETAELWYEISEDSRASIEARRVREGWLRGTTDTAP
jgi:predicted metalloprotease with PDZ domain